MKTTTKKKPQAGAKAKRVKPKQPALARHRLLRSKLEALAQRGIDGERTAAQGKLDRLLAKYDFVAPSVDLKDIFGGTFVPASVAVPVAVIPEMDIASAVKWSFETTVKIPCVFQGNNLLAQADAKTAERMARIAVTVAQSFRELWAVYAKAGANPADRNCFMLGLYEGMMNDTREGQALPSRAAQKVSRGNRRSVSRPSGLNLHPYSVAVGLGRSIRFEIPIVELTAQLTQALTKHLN